MKKTESPATSESSKTVERFRARFGREDIYVSMEHLPDLDTFRYKVECYGCENQCDYSFLYRKKLSFAFVGKLAGVFSSPCVKLGKAEANKDRPGGQLNLMFSANSHNYEV